MNRKQYLRGMAAMAAVCLLSMQAYASEEAVTVTALKGPTAMGMVKMMDQADQGELAYPYDFSIMSAIDEVTPLIAKGSTDIAAVLANLASVLYNNTDGQIEVLAINTLGVLYIVENGESVTGIEDLKGKTLYASGKGATPEYALNFILQENGLDPETDVTIEWKSEHAECLVSVLEDENGIAMLPQPFVTTAQAKADTLRVALDLTEEWQKTQEGKENPSSMITGVVVANRTFVEENPDAVEDFMKNYEASVSFVNENVEEAAALIGGYEIVPEQVAVKALPACSITFIDGEEMKTALSGYLAVLMEQNPKAVGGALPGDDFYYMGAAD